MSLKCIVWILLMPLGVFGQARLHSATSGAGGSSKTIWIGSSAHVVQQSIGQSSVIGAYQHGAYALRQGFIQPRYASARFTDDAVLHISVFPNPFKDKIIIAVSGDNNSAISLEIADLQGRNLFSQETSAAETIIDVGPLPAGQYILKLKATRSIHIIKLIKL